MHSLRPPPTRPQCPCRAARSLIQTRNLPDVQRWLATLAAFREAPEFGTADVALKQETERLHGELQAAQGQLGALLERVASAAGLDEELVEAERARAAAEARARAAEVRFRYLCRLSARLDCGGRHCGLASTCHASFKFALKEAPHI